MRYEISVEDLWQWKTSQSCRPLLDACKKRFREEGTDHDLLAGVSDHDLLYSQKGSEAVSAMEPAARFPGPGAQPRTVSAVPKAGVVRHIGRGGRGFARGQSQHSYCHETPLDILMLHSKGDDNDCGRSICNDQFSGMKGAAAI